MLWLVTTIDARRPASWIALAAAGWSGWWVSAGTPGTASSVVMLMAAVLAVAAIGDLPSERLVAPGADLRGGWSLLRACERAVWPWAGMQIGIWAAGECSLPAAGAAGLGGLLAALTIEAARRRGARAADAASLALLTAAASGAVGIGGVTAAGLAGCGVMGMAWLAAGGLIWAGARLHPAAPPAATAAADPVDASRHGVEMVSSDILPANGPVRQWLSGIGMVASLAMMAGWLVLDPMDRAGGDGRPPWTTLAWGVGAAAWFIALAVPQATLQDGVAGAADWDRLLRSAAWKQRVAGSSFGRMDRARPGSTRFAAGVAWSLANILAWPTLICAALTVTTPSAALPPLGIAAGLAALAVVVMVVVAAVSAGGGSRETAFALCMTLVVIVATWLCNFCPPRRQVGSPNSPSSAALTSPRLPGGRPDPRQLAEDAARLQNFAVRVEKMTPDTR